LASAIALALLVVSALSTGATTVTLAPDQDSYTSSENPATNYGSSSDLYIGKGTYWGEGYFRGYLSFDLTGYESEEVLSASLSLYQYDTAPAAGGLPCDLHRVVAAWDESTITWSTQPAHDGTVIDSRDVGDSFYTGWITWNVTSLVIDWIENGVTNQGLVIKHYSEHPAGASRYGIFHSQDSGATALRPVLVIEFRDESPVHDVTWGAIKGLFR
jgi:hypothetical protein